MLARAVLATLTTTLTVCPTSATILPLPAISPISTSLPATEITYYQGLSPPSEAGVYSGTCNAIVVAQGQLTAGYCVILETYAVSIGRLQGTECAFKMFKGSTNCEADATDIVSSWPFLTVMSLWGCFVLTRMTCR